MATEIETILQEYTSKLAVYETERDRLYERTDRLERQLESRRAALNRLRGPYWRDEVVGKLAELLAPHFPEYSTYELMGPFGMQATLSIHFYKEAIKPGDPWLEDNCISVAFVPGRVFSTTGDGQVDLLDTATDTGQYGQGTMGDVNGMNHPRVPMPDTIEELVAWMKRDWK